MNEEKLGKMLTAYSAEVQAYVLWTAALVSKFHGHQTAAWLLMSLGFAEWSLFFAYKYDGRCRSLWKRLGANMDTGGDW